MLKLKILMRLCNFWGKNRVELGEVKIYTGFLLFNQKHLNFQNLA